MDYRRAPGSEEKGGWLEPSLLPISLVIATRNRGSRLEACLRAVASSDFDPRRWELIVVDNGSTDDTANVVRAAQAYMPTTIKYVFEPARGASAARNAGAAVSLGGVIAFTDDDCYVASDFLARVVAAFEEDLRLGWVSGRVELHDPSDAAITINRSQTPRSFASKVYLYTDDVIGANLSFRRGVMNVVCGYDELLGAGAPLAAAEDIDIVSRAAARGWSGAYDPRIVVSHHHGRKSSDVAPLFKNYDIGRGAYTIKYLYRGQIAAFLKGVVSLRFRLGPIKTWLTREKRSMAFWETYGGFAYSGLRIMQMLGLRSLPKRRHASATCLPPITTNATKDPDFRPATVGEGD